MALALAIRPFQCCPKKVSKEMAFTPNFDELKEQCNSNRLEHCFRFLFMQEASHNDGFITFLEEECEEVRRRMRQQRALLQEGKRLSPFDPVSVDGLQCIKEALYKDGQLLAALVVVLDLARDARDEKRAHVSVMEQYG